MNTLHRKQPLWRAIYIAHIVVFFFLIWFNIMSIYRKPIGEYGEVQRRKQESWVLWASRDGHSSSVCVFPSSFFSLYVYLCQSHGWEDSPEKEMATHSSTLALKIPWTEKLGAGYYPCGRKELGMTERLHFLSFTFMVKVWGLSVLNLS